MKIALRSVSNGLIASVWDQPALTTNRAAVGIGEQFEVLVEVNGQWVPYDPAPPVPPVPPQPILPPYRAGMDPHAWFLEVVAGQPFGQATLIGDEPVLNANGWLLTPPNHDTPPARTKVKPPDYANYFRVGFGEGYWVWIAEPV